MGFFARISAKWNTRSDTGTGFRAFTLKQKTSILACITMALVCFVLSIVAIASPVASTSGSGRGVYALAGGIIGVALSIVLLAHAMYLNQRARKRDDKNERFWDWATLSALALTFLFSVTAVAVAS